MPEPAPKLERTEYPTDCYRCASCPNRPRGAHCEFCHSGFSNPEWWTVECNRCGAASPVFSRGNEDASNAWRARHSRECRKR